MVSTTTPTTTTIRDVIASMQRIQAALPENDGVAWFNRLYTRVTENVAARLGTGYFANDAFIARMDVVFAGYYFRALEASPVPRCWAPLVDARADTSIAPLAFALAGMNAHINHDLALTVLDMSRERGAILRRGTPEHDDYARINDVLSATIEDVKPWLERGITRAIDDALGRADEAAEIFSIANAREGAWTAGETFWALRDSPDVSRAYEASLDRIVGMASRAMLAIARRV